MTPAHVVLTPVGSAGDVNPFLMLGGALRRRGHRVTLISSAAFGAVASAAGLEFEPLGSADEYEQLIRDPALWDPRQGPKVVFGAVAESLRAGYAAIERVYEPDRTVLVGHSLSFFTRVFEERHHVPAATVHLSPSVFRSDYRQPVAPVVGDLSRWPRWIRRTMWWAIDRSGIDPLIVPALNRWRAELGLPPVHRVLRTWVHSPRRVLALFPPWFGDPQTDWPPQTRLTGFVLSDESCGPPANDRGLDAFLAAGEPPVVATPGSANRFGRPFFDAVLHAAQSTGRRAVFVTRYREQLPDALPASVYHASYASFSTLFPRAAAVVHHGGIGTCAQAFAAGIPQLIMPLGFDQPDNGARVVRLGVGETIVPASFTGSRVVSALERLLGDDRVAQQCRTWRHEIDSPAAIEAACALVE